jgi:hypothetical protein
MHDAILSFPLFLHRLCGAWCLKIMVCWDMILCGLVDRYLSTELFGVTPQETVIIIHLCGPQISHKFHFVMVADEELYDLY